MAARSVPRLITKAGNSTALAKRFECNLDIKTIKNERYIFGISSVVCLAGYGYGYYNGDEANSIWWGLGGLVSGLIAIFSGKVGGNVGTRDLPGLVPTDSLVGSISIPRAIVGGGFTMFGDHGAGVHSAYRVLGSTVHLVAWNGSITHGSASYVGPKKRDGGYENTQVDDGDYINLNVDYDNDYRSQYYFDDQESWYEVAQTFWDSGFGEDENDYNAGVSMETYCMVPVDTNNDPVFIGTVWLNDGASQNPNCDSQVGGSGQFNPFAPSRR